MRNKFIFALFMSIFVLIAGGCQSPADNTHAMRMNYQSERYTDEDFETVTEMIVKDLQQNHPERKAIRFVYTGDAASDYYGSVDRNPQDDEPGESPEGHDWMLFYVHFEDLKHNEYSYFFSKDENSAEWNFEGAYPSGVDLTVPEELLPQEVINAREEIEERVPLAD